MIIDTVTCRDGVAYTLAKQNNGDFVITDSDGNMQELTGLAQAEAYEIFYSQHGGSEQEQYERSAIELQRYGIDIK